jgi:S1-C subfamily serine protease
MESKVTEGIISSLSGIDDDPTRYQMSVQIQPGISGGPLFDSSAAVIGITSGALNHILGYIISIVL